MSENALQRLALVGQSVWYDNLSRELLQKGELRRLIGLGVLGVTVNPTIFEKAVSEGASYDDQIRELALAGRSTEEIYDQLISGDVRSACDELLATYRETDARDGYVSLEVSPALARDARNTVAAAGRYWTAVDRPNLLIKIPATAEGVGAIEEALFQGFNVNVTLIFAVARYREVMEAYCRGLERRLESGRPVEKLHSVASFFVSRVDTEADSQLDVLAEQAEGERRQELEAARGKAAIANAAVAYQAFLEVFHGARFEKLAAAGAQVQRPLWASTSTKNPAYRDVLYCEELIAPETVNTMPPSSIEAFLDHGEVRPTLVGHIPAAAPELAHMRELGVDIDQVTALLEVKGVESFSASMDKLLAEVGAKRAGFAGQGLVASPRTQVSSRVMLAQVEAATAGHALAEAASQLQSSKATTRLRDRDTTLWPGDEAGRQAMAERMGWLDEPQRQRSAVAGLHRYSGWVRDQGFSHAVLVGMGGSSLCPEVLRQTFGVQPGFPDLIVLDSTDPDQIQSVVDRVDPARTLLVVSSKSGGTTETLCHCSFFYSRWQAALGDGAGAHCVAVTDPGTHLEKLARDLNFHQVWSANPAIGGRYSALSDFGMVPAATMGIDVDQLLAGAVSMSEACFPDSSAAAERNPGAQLGAVLAGAAAVGRDKVTILAHPGLQELPTWIEQLLAESTGKLGKGLVPVVGEPLGEPREYGGDRLFVYLELEGDGGDPATEKWLAEIGRAGHPVVRIPTAHLLDLGAEFYRWEVATALAGSLIGINPFDQPNVQESKDNTTRLLESWEKDRRLPEPAIDLIDGSVRVAGAPGAVSLEQALVGWLEGLGPPWYLGVMAYLPMRPDHPGDAALIARLRAGLLRATGCATTFGYGPRFLHSTGQLHKGGPETVAFLQITGVHSADLSIPERPYTFGILQQAQALGDYQALTQRGRRVLRVRCEDVGRGLEQLTQVVERLLLAPVAN
ncbi:MAG TPA: bifunctional transaldolase/phosoglucose isomerase [Candidatus Nanopelagicaceae bacterium]|nr:bifunctional transaldolase/phosoglucose isomerase [Candidatus Nanopelagicaceae bacterium]